VVLKLEQPGGTGWSASYYEEKLNCKAYRNGDELEGDIANGDIDGIQNRKRGEDECFTLSETGGDLISALDGPIRLTKAPFSKAK
jgi:hypothetical protein